MTKDEELKQLREENTALRAQVAWLTERMSVLEAQHAKDSHNSHWPPSSDRFHRQPKSLFHLLSRSREWSLFFFKDAPILLDFNISV